MTENDHADQAWVARHNLGGDGLGPPALGFRIDDLDRMPPVAVMKQLGKMTPAERAKAAVKIGERRAVNGVSQMCASCHDSENDPRFDIFTYWSKVVHPAAKK